MADGSFQAVSCNWFGISWEISSVHTFGQKVLFETYRSVKPTLCLSGQWIWSMSSQIWPSQWEWARCILPGPREWVPINYELSCVMVRAGDEFFMMLWRDEVNSWILLFSDFSGYFATATFVAMGCVVPLLEYHRRLQFPRALSISSRLLAWTELISAINVAFN